MNILHSSDWHILLHKKKVPYEWQKNRFNLFFNSLLELQEFHDIHIMSGDIFDKKPEPDEICLFLTYLNRVTIPTYFIPGNHEATKKGESFLTHFQQENTINNPLVNIITKNTRINFNNQWFQFFPYGEMQIDNLPEYINGDILVTHIRGKVGENIAAEYDFEKIKSWKLCLIGDLHFNHKHEPYNAYYPGSPLNVVFDRDEKRSYGVNSIEFNSIEDYKVTFIDLKLPKLIRKTIDKKELMIPDSYDHVIYEITGSIDELSKIKNSDLLDKKIAHKNSEDSKINLKNKSELEELKEYLMYIKIDNIDSLLEEYNSFFGAAWE